MISWQWSVLIALIRYVLRRDGVDIPSMYYGDKPTEDINLLVEAVIIDDN